MTSRLPDSSDSSAGLARQGSVRSRGEASQDGRRVRAARYRIVRVQSTTPDELQVNLDTFMAFYNFRRTHQGYRVAGRTPAKALFDLIAQGRLLPPISPTPEDVALAS